MTLHHGDCLDVMAAMEPESVDAIVTDPPYGLEFMGKEWDRIARRTNHPLDPSKEMVRDSSAEPRAKDNPWQKEASGYGAPQKNWRCRRCGRLKFGQDKYRCTCESPDWDARTREYGMVMQQWHQQWAEAAYRVAKPSAYLLAFGGTRTVHRMTVALEDAGWIIRDMLVWGYASGFPKSKASLKPAWEPIVMARKPGPLRMLNIDSCRITSPTDDPSISPDGSGSSGAYSSERIGPWNRDDPRLHNPSTVLRAWSAARPEADSAPLANALADAFLGRGLLGSQGGYPSCRHCDDGLARIAEAADRDDSPLRPDVPGAPPLREWSLSRIRESRCDDHLSTWDELARVVEEAGVLPSGNDTPLDIQRNGRTGEWSADKRYTEQGGTNIAALPGPRGGDPAGRWPANVILTDPIFDGGWDGVVGGGEASTGGSILGDKEYADIGYHGNLVNRSRFDSYGDSGTYSRFFLIPKADRSDREPVLGGLPLRKGGSISGAETRPDRPTNHPMRANHHPTVKPTDLMRHLVRLVTPSGGVVLDPFLGSGTTALAAEMEGFAWIGIEREAEYVAIAEARLNGTQRGLGLEDAS